VKIALEKPYILAPEWLYGHQLLDLRFVVDHYYFLYPPPRYQGSGGFGKKIEENCWSDHYSGQSSNTKESCSSIIGIIRINSV